MLILSFTILILYSASMLSLITQSWYYDRLTIAIGCLIILLPMILSIMTILNEVR